MRVWVLLFIVKQMLAATCPVTYRRIGQLVELISLIATIVFIVLVFSVTKDWKLGVGAIGIFVIVPLLMPKVRTDNISGWLRLYSLVGSVLDPILLAWMYFSLFKMDVPVYWAVIAFIVLILLYYLSEYVFNKDDSEKM